MVLLSSCASNSSNSEEPVPAISLDCSGVIDTTAVVDPGFAVVAGAVALPSESELWNVDEPHSSRGVDGWYGAKIPLYVKAGADVVLSALGAPDGTGLRFYWGTNGPPVPVESYRVNCDSTTSDEWLVFPGAMWVSKPQCVGIEVSAGGSTETARLPLGAECQ